MWLMWKDMEGNEWTAACGLEPCWLLSGKSGSLPYPVVCLHLHGAHPAVRKEQICEFYAVYIVFEDPCENGQHIGWP